MTNVVDMEQFRRGQNQPDPDCVTQDSEGKDMFAFALEFEHEGSTFAIRLWAYDFDDAERRAASLRQSLAVRGQIIAEE